MCFCYAYNFVYLFFIGNTRIPLEFPPHSHTKGDTWVLSHKHHAQQSLCFGTHSYKDSFLNILFIGDIFCLFLFWRMVTIPYSTQSHGVSFTLCIQLWCYQNLHTIMMQKCCRILCIYHMISIVTFIHKNAMSLFELLWFGYGYPLVHQVGNIFKRPFGWSSWL